MTLDDVIEERQTTSLTSQRALTDTGEMAVGIEFQTIEHRHYTDVLHTTILYNGIEDDLAMGIHILEFMPGDMLQKCRHGEDGTGTEPTAHVVSRHVVKHRIARNLEDVILQLLQRRHTRHLLLCHRVTEDEVAEAHVFLNEFMEVHIEFGRVLVDEMEALCLGLRAVDGLGGIEDQRHILVTATDLTQQFQTSLRVTLLHMRQPPGHRLHGETGIRDHAQRVIMVLLIDLHRLLVVGGKHHLGASALTLSSGMGVQGLRREPLRLGEDIVIEVWQDGRVETDVILHQQDHLHTRLLDIVLNVHLVLQQLDDRHDEVGIAQPAEHIVEHRHILVLDALRDTM